MDGGKKCKEKERNYKKQGGHGGCYTTSFCASLIGLHVNCDVIKGHRFHNCIRYALCRQLMEPNPKSSSNYSGCVADVHS